MATIDHAAPVPPDEPGSVARKPSRVWIWVIVVCAVQVAVWTAWFIFAAHHPVEEIPVATGTSRSATP